MYGLSMRYRVAHVRTSVVTCYSVLLSNENLNKRVWDKLSGLANALCCWTSSMGLEVERGALLYRCVCAGIFAIYQRSAILTQLARAVCCMHIGFAVGKSLNGL